jgi:outer membrane protein TolC
MTRQSRVLPVVCLALALAAGPAAFTQERPVLELSLEDAVKRALESNADILVQKYTPESSAQDVRAAEGFYDTFFTSAVAHGKSSQLPSDPFVGGAQVETTSDIWNFGFSQAAPWGASFGLTFNNRRQDTNSVFQNFNPSFTSSLNASLVQPLLRNLKIDSARQQLRLAKKNREISDLQFQEIVVNTVASAKQAYYDLVFSQDNLEAARKNLALAQKLLEENEIRVKVGTMAPLDVVSAQSEVASREEGVIVAENTQAEAEDILKRTIFPANDPATWELRIVPTDRPTAQAYPVDLNSAIQRALEKRTDVVAARKSIEQADISLQFARNQVLPGVDFVASYGGAGIGGTGLVRDPPLGGEVVDTIPGGYGDALDDVFGFNYPTWRIGVNVSYPILNRQAKAASAQARIAKDQALASYRRLELSVAAEVRSAGRAVDTNFKRVASTRAARVLAAQRLDAEEKKFAAGMSTNFLVTQAQRDLAVAEVSELRAVLDFHKSQITFERTQEAGLAGSTSVTRALTGTLGSRGTTGAALTAAVAGQ